MCESEPKRSGEMAITTASCVSNDKGRVLSSCYSRDDKGTLFERELLWMRGEGLDPAAKREERLEFVCEADESKVIE